MERKLTSESSIKDTLEASVFGKVRYEDTITVTLADGQVANYTKGILPMMIGDPIVKRIVDNATGEIIYEA